MKRLIIVLSLTVLLLSLNGCGVMFGGSKFSGSIIAKNHPNAEISVNGNVIGKGTAIGLFKRNRPLTVELSQEGCEKKVQTFDNTFRAGNFVLSLVMWGIPGIAIDLGTGACYKPDHKGNPAIEKLDTKSFVFIIDYAGCASE